MAARVEIGSAGRAPGVTYIREGEHVEHTQRARSEAVVGWSAELPDWS